MDHSALLPRLARTSEDPALVEHARCQVVADLQWRTELLKLVQQILDLTKAIHSITTRRSQAAGALAQSLPRTEVRTDVSLQIAFRHAGS
jgi:hypothetical protein